MARVCFFLQPTRSAPNFIACVVLVACTIFLLISVLLQCSTIGVETVLHSNGTNTISAEFLDSLPEFLNDPIVVLAITSRRLRAITNHLQQLKRLRPGNGSSFPIIVSQDGDQSDVTEFIRLFVEKTPFSYFIHHKNRPEWTGSPKDRVNCNYFYIAQHYKWALDQIFFTMNFSAAIITEEDLDIANDFFEYFGNSRRLLYEDPTVWCVSAWNDNGAPSTSDWQRIELLYRTDFFPGLGWMLTADLWRELSPKWPSIYWDDWMRSRQVRKDRVCIRPEISRTLHNMVVAGKGTSGGMFKQNLAAIRLPDGRGNFSQPEIDGLFKTAYDKLFGEQILASQPIEIAQLLEDDFRKNVDRFSTNHSYRFTFHDPREYRVVAKKFGIMYDVRSGMLRTSYCGVVTFLVDGVRIYAIHSNLNLARLFGSDVCSTIYDERWDLMGKYLDFADVFCTSKKWIGKCNPKDPEMIKWFENTRQMARLKAWGEMIVF